MGPTKERVLLAEGHAVTGVDNFDPFYDPVEVGVPRFAEWILRHHEPCAS